MKPATTIALALGCMAAAAARGRDWYNDLMMRGYARDWILSPSLVPPGSWDAVTQASADTCLPPGWVASLAQAGVPTGELPQRSVRVAARVRQMGPPPSVDEQALIRYRRAALEAGVAEGR